MTDVTTGLDTTTVETRGLGTTTGETRGPGTMTDEMTDEESKSAISLSSSRRRLAELQLPTRREAQIRREAKVLVTCLPLTNR